MIETFLKENIFHAALKAMKFKVKSPILMDKAIVGRDSAAALGDIV